MNPSEILPNIPPRVYSDSFRHPARIPFGISAAVVSEVPPGVLFTIHKGFLLGFSRNSSTDFSGIFTSNFSLDSSWNCSQDFPLVSSEIVPGIFPRTAPRNPSDILSEIALGIPPQVIPNILAGIASMIPSEIYLSRNFSVNSLKNFSLRSLKNSPGNFFRHFLWVSSRNLSRN